MICHLSPSLAMIIESIAQQTRYLAIEEVMKSSVWTKPYETRRSFIGGSDARIIMGGDRGAQPILVRAQHQPAGPRRAALGQAFGNSLDGGHPGRDCGGHGGVRGQVHAALVVFRGGGGRKVHG